MQDLYEACKNHCDMNGIEPIDVSLTPYIFNKDAGKEGRVLKIFLDEKGNFKIKTVEENSLYKCYYMVISPSGTKAAKFPILTASIDPKDKTGKICHAKIASQVKNALEGLENGAIKNWGEKFDTLHERFKSVDQKKLVDAINTTLKGNSLYYFVFELKDNSANTASNFKEINELSMKNSEANSYLDKFPPIKFPGKGNRILMTGISNDIWQSRYGRTKSSNIKVRDKYAGVIYTAMLNILAQENYNKTYYKNDGEFIVPMYIRGDKDEKIDSDIPEELRDIFLFNGDMLPEEYANNVRKICETYSKSKDSVLNDKFVIFRFNTIGTNKPSITYNTQHLTIDELVGRVEKWNDFQKTKYPITVSKFFHFINKKYNQKGEDIKIERFSYYDCIKLFLGRENPSKFYNYFVNQYNSFMFSVCLNGGTEPSKGSKIKYNRKNRMYEFISIGNLLKSLNEEYNLSSSKRKDQR